MDILLQGRMLKQAIKSVYGPVRRKYDLRQIDIEILFTLAEYTDVSSSDIYRGQLLNKGQVSRALDSLCRKGYLTVIHDENDHRQNRYRITEAGMPAVREICTARGSLMCALMKGITAEQEHAFREIAELVFTNLAKMTEESEDAADQGYLETV